ncbi:MAG: ScyD/ScyE family protein [archaeon]
MKRNLLFYFIALVIISLMFVSCAKDAESPTESLKSPGTSLEKISHDGYTTIVTGLNQPRGLRFGPDGCLYVGESGTAASISTAGLCDQVPPPVGPYLGGNTGRISRIDWHHIRYTVADCLPNTRNSPAVGGDFSSIADVAFWGGQMYALLTGAGCSHGHTDYPNSLIQVNKDGSWKVVANISSFLKANPVVNPEADDFEPDGDLYSMVILDMYAYFIESNHGELDRVDLRSGRIERVVDISKTEGHIVPTALTYRDGYFYVGNLTTIPYPAGSAKILKIAKNGGYIDTYATGFTTILGLRFDILGRLYVLETSSQTGQPPFLFPNSGTIKRLDHRRNVETIATGLNRPTAMTFGPDLNLYVSTGGYMTAPGQGEIVRVRVPFFRFAIPFLFDLDDEMRWLLKWGWRWN